MVVKIGVVKVHKNSAWNLCKNTIIHRRTGWYVKEKTRNSYILHKILCFKIFAKNRIGILSYMLCCGWKNEVLQ